MNYEILANAIVEQAAKDYRWARTALGKDSENVGAAAMRSETEQFFHSAWFALLTCLDGEWLLQKLEGEFA
ncbi:hypothetical protein [uncultured Selenomonas sp.]|uniref:hypothetical protein n=1 Tax=uncultured Selenomonas sp. TaxID=159275 RepID=UPI0028E33C70|nr:hypothetical protein [uncultured Selenomonas sp.]